MKWLDWAGRFSQTGQICTALADLLLPTRCPFCDTHCDSGASGQSGHVTCESCHHLLVQTPVASCTRCGAAVGAWVNTQQGCVHCRRRPIRFDSVTCLGMYEDQLRDAVLSAKWSYSSVALATLTELLVRQHRDRLLALNCELVLPIPQSWVGRLTRRFNPAAVVADHLADRMKLPSDLHILRRSRTTRPQKRVSVNRRYENQKASFRVRDRHLLKNRTVLLVDDVLTTGATCSEAARLLKSAGAKECHVAVIARVLGNA